MRPRRPCRGGARPSARALPRDLLRDAVARVLDDPLRPAGEELGARLHRRLQPARQVVRRLRARRRRRTARVLRRRGDRRLRRRRRGAPLSRLALRAARHRRSATTSCASSISARRCSGVVYANYVAAGALGGLGGALAALAVGHVDPEMAYWTTSGEFVFIAVLGGTGNVLAPFLAARRVRGGAHARQPVRAEHVADDARHRHAAAHPVPARAGCGRSSCGGRRGAWMPTSWRRDGVNRSFGAVVAAADVNVAVEPESVVGLIGANGAGKTTFINMVTGYLKPVLRVDPLRRPGADRARAAPRHAARGVAARSRFRSSSTRLSMRENLLVAVGIVAAAAHAWAHSDLAPQRSGAAHRRDARAVRARAVSRPPGRPAARGRAQAARRRDGAGREAALSCCSTSPRAACPPTRSSRSWTW